MCTRLFRSRQPSLSPGSPYLIVPAKAPERPLWPFACGLQAQASAKQAQAAALWVYWNTRKWAWDYTCTWADAQVPLDSVLRGDLAGRKISIAKQHKEGAVRLGDGAQPAALWTLALPTECTCPVDCRASQAWRCTPMFCGHRVQSMQLSGSLQHHAERRILAAGQYEAGAVRLGQHARRAPGAPVSDTRRCHMARIWLTWGVLVVTH